MSSLTPRQQAELHKAIASYIGPRVGPELSRDVCAALGVPQDEVSADNILEKKWSTVIRLQKKILDLESQVRGLNELIESSQGYFRSAQVQNGIYKNLNWVPSRRSKQLVAHKAAVNSIDIHPFLPELVAGLADGTFMIWDLLNLTQPVKLIGGHTKAVNDVCYSSKGLKLNGQGKESVVLATASSDLNIKIWDCGDDYELKRTLSGHAHTVSCVRFKPNNPSHLFSSSRDGNIILWDVTNGYRLKTFVAHSDWVRSLDIGSNGEFVLSCSNDQSARLSHGDSGTGLSAMIGHGHVIEDCKFVPSLSWSYLDAVASNFTSDEVINNPLYAELGFKYCVTASRDESIRVWMLPLPTIRPHRPPMPSANPSALCLLELKGHTSWVRRLQFHPGGKFLFSASDDKTIKVWDLSSTEKLGTIKCIRTLTNGHDGFINCLKFASPTSFDTDLVAAENEKELDKSIRCIFASGGTDNCVTLWS